MPAQSGGCVLESVESGGGELGAAEDVVGEGGVFEDYGEFFEEFV